MVTSANYDSRLVGFYRPQKELHSVDEQTNPTSLTTDIYKSVVEMADPVKTIESFSLASKDVSRRQSGSRGGSSTYVDNSVNYFGGSTTNNYGGSSGSGGKSDGFAALILGVVCAAAAALLVDSYSKEAKQYSELTKEVNKLKQQIYVTRHSVARDYNPDYKLFKDLVNDYHYLLSFQEPFIKKTLVITLAVSAAFFAIGGVFGSVASIGAAKLTLTVPTIAVLLNYTWHKFWRTEDIYAARVAAEANQLVAQTMLR